MRVQRVLPPGGPESWTVIGSDLRQVAPIERYLAWLSRIERAPTTLRAYAHDLKAFWEFVEGRGIEWDRISLEQLGEFTAWLRSPADNVVVLATGRPARASSTVNRILTAVFGFYEFHARDDVPVARALVDERRMGRGAFKPFLHGIAASRPRGRVGRLRQERRVPATLSVEPGGRPERSASWEQLLRASVRPEFQVEVYLPEPGDPVLFGPTCAVAGCDARGLQRATGIRGFFCQAHAVMWRRDGEPPQEQWVRQGARSLRRARTAEACSAVGCLRSAHTQGLCHPHYSHWRRAGRPPLELFVATRRRREPAPGSA